MSEEEKLKAPGGFCAPIHFEMPPAPSIVDFIRDMPPMTAVRGEINWNRDTTPYKRPSRARRRWVRFTTKLRWRREQLAYLIAPSLRRDERDYW